jgi:hypothetical protein
MQTASMRAQQCRELAKPARDENSRRTLADMSVELDAEADLLDAQMGKRKGKPS